MSQLQSLYASQNPPDFQQIQLNRTLARTDSFLSIPIMYIGNNKEAAVCSMTKTLAAL